MPNDYISLLVQLPLVGIFIWFTLRRDQMSIEAQERRDREWREFLGEQRQATNTALARLAEEIKVNTQITSNLQAILIAHDQATRLTIPQVNELLTRISIADK